MQRNAAIRWFGAPVLALAALLIVGFIAFVPFTKEPAYQFVESWGSQGADLGQFHDPTGLAIAGEKLFVSDSRNGRIQVFDFDGKMLQGFGQPGEALGALGRPMNLAVHNDELYVAEYFNDRIQVFSLNGTARRVIGETGDGPGQFNAPGGVAVAANGALLVADFYNQRVQYLRPDGSFVKQWGTTGKVGITAGAFNYPTDVAIAPSGTLIVADGYNDRIQTFDSNGEFSSKWGGPLAMNIFGPFNGWFSTVTGVATDRQGNVFAADFYNHRIQKFAADGTFLTKFGRQGDGPGEFQYPMAVAIADNGTVYVTDFGNHRIQKWRPKVSGAESPIEPKTD